MRLQGLPLAGGKATPSSTCPASRSAPIFWWHSSGMSRLKKPWSVMMLQRLPPAGGKATPRKRAPSEASSFIFARHSTGTFLVKKVGFHGGMSVLHASAADGPQILVSRSRLFVVAPGMRTSEQHDVPPFLIPIARVLSPVQRARGDPDPAGSWSFGCFWWSPSGVSARRDRSTDWGPRVAPGNGHRCHPSGPFPVHVSRRDSRPAGSALGQLDGDSVRRSGPGERQRSHARAEGRTDQVQPGQPQLLDTADPVVCVWEARLN
jgi:hypothetical protein